MYLLLCLNSLSNFSNTGYVDTAHPFRHVDSMEGESEHLICVFAARDRVLEGDSRCFSVSLASGRPGLFLANTAEEPRLLPLSIFLANMAEVSTIRHSIVPTRWAEESPSRWMLDIPGQLGRGMHTSVNTFGYCG